MTLTRRHQKITLRGWVPVSAVAVAIGLASSVALAADSSNEPLGVTSSLDGKQVLPIESRWLANPKVAAAKVAEVDYLIDGTLRCVELAAPYNYGSDDFQGHLGSLVTTWLSPGKHRFTVRVLLKNGQKASHTVAARVLPAPEPPAALRGVRWHRTVTQSELDQAGADLPPGDWQLVFDRIGIWELDLIDSGIVEHGTFRGQTIILGAPPWMTPVIDGRGKPPVNRYGHHDFGFGIREDGTSGNVQLVGDG